jgi:toxic protein SymE
MNTQDQVTTQNASANTSATKPRRLKVGYKPLKSPGVEVPFLPLRGRWLRDAGFDIGRNVKIEVSEGRLTIEPVD